VNRVIIAANLVRIPRITQTIGYRFHLIVSENDADTHITCGEVVNFTGVALFEGFGFVYETVTYRARRSLNGGILSCRRFWNRSELDLEWHD
jgi:hypothetical protein